MFESSIRLSVQDFLPRAVMIHHIICSPSFVVFKFMCDEGFIWMPNFRSSKIETRLLKNMTEHLNLQDIFRILSIHLLGYSVSPPALCCPMCTLQTSIMRTCSDMSKGISDLPSSKKYYCFWWSLGTSFLLLTFNFPGQIS